MISSSKKAAIEMSVGTIVVIVLSMVVLVLGIFFVQQIFNVGSGAVDSVDAEVQNQIQKLFDEDGARVAIYPTSRRISLDQGDRDRGFAFGISNQETTPTNFGYSVLATDASNCQGIDESTATSYLIGGSGETGNIGSGDTFGPNLVTFIIPEAAPLCTIEYALEVQRDDGTVYRNLNFFVTIE